MKILGINGSPRPGGNTELLLDHALTGAKSLGAEVEKVTLNQLKFTPCQECENAPSDGSCFLSDDFKELYPKILEADGIILASPIFFGSLSAQTKMMIDRFQCYWKARFLFNTVKSGSPKAGIFISVEASQRPDFFQNAKALVKNFFATINAGYQGELFAPGMEKKAQILESPEILQNAFELGQKLALLLTKPETLTPVSEFPL